MRVHRWLPVALLIASACGDDSDVETAGTDDGEPPLEAAADGAPRATRGDTTASDVAPASGIEWQPLDGSGDVEEAVFEVPIDYDDPDAGRFALYLVRHKATDDDERIGALLVNPGGPGFGGSQYAARADAIYGSALTERFDIIGWDPRGTGRSEPAIDCIDDYDRYFAVDMTPESDAERQQVIDRAEELTEQCVTNNDGYLGHVGTNNSARDMDLIREALGEDEISYFGFSYGSELGAVWATLFPDTVRAAVLDGAADPTAGLDEGSLQQLIGFEQSLDTFLAWCSGSSSCAFHERGDADDAESAFDELMDALDANPVPSEPGRPDVNRTVARQATIAALYSERLWPDLAAALTDAHEGDGAGLLGLYDIYYQRRSDGTWGNELEAFQVIRCMDTDERPTVAEDDETALEFNEAAPRLSPETVGSYFCTFFPEAPDPRVDITGAGAGPLLVVGTTGDPATPLEGSRVMADTLDEGVLLVVDADEHTGYHVNDCSRSVVEAYLVDLELPTPGTEC